VTAKTLEEGGTQEGVYGKLRFKVVLDEKDKGRGERKRPTDIKTPAYDNEARRKG